MGAGKLNAHPAWDLARFPGTLPTSPGLVTDPTRWERAVPEGASLSLGLSRQTAVCGKSRGGNRKGLFTEMCSF